MSDFYEHCDDYTTRLGRAWLSVDRTQIAVLASELTACRYTKRFVYLVGDGGSAANAMHFATDLMLCGIRAIALPANSSTITCLGNDFGFDTVFSWQLALLAEPGDVLIALSGSGNSPNILKALEHARAADLRSFAVLGYGGGKAKALAGTVIHTRADDMQPCEDTQSVVFHIIMQWLRAA